MSGKCTGGADEGVVHFRHYRRCYHKSEKRSNDRNSEIIGVTLSAYYEAKSRATQAASASLRAGGGTGVR